MLRVSDLLKGKIDADVFRVLLDNVVPSKTLLGKQLPQVSSWRFCDVIDFGAMDLLDASFQIADRYLGLSSKKILRASAVEYVSFVKHIMNEFKTVAGLFKQLEREPDADMVSAGLDKMDRFGVLSIYYGIDKNPLRWDEISEVEFGKMYTKLMMDKITAEVQEAYAKRQQEKAKQRK